MELLERDHCFATLTEWLKAAIGSSGSVVLVAGEAGVGKSWLLQKFANSQDQARVLWGTCDALFTPRPLAPFHDIARQIALIGGRGIPSLQSILASGAGRDTIFAAALEELERDRSPGLVIIEDAHWADEATLDLLKFIGRRIHRTRTMLVVTYRDDEVGPTHPLQFVIGDLPPESVRRLQLAPLSEVAVAKLARAAGRSAKGLHSVTRGNPFFVTEILAGPGHDLPLTIKDAVLARATRLSPAAREIAELVSVVPGKAEPWLLEEATLFDERAVESCVSIGMVLGADGSLAFRHELARRAFEDSLSSGRQQSLHGRVLGVLARRPGISPARLVHHANRAGNGPDVLQFAPIAAAQAAAVGAHREAASHYRIALRYGEHLPAEERAKLLEQLSHECYLTDQIDSAIEARKAALTIWRSAGARAREGDTNRWLSRLNWYAGRKSEADRYAASAISLLEPLPPGPEIAMAYSNRSQLEMLASETASAIAWANKAIDLATATQNTETLCHALNNRGTARLLAGDDQGREDLLHSLKLALEGGWTEHAARAHTNLSTMSITARRYAQGAKEMADAIAYCEERDLDPWLLYLKAWRARMKFEQGDWVGASEDAQAVLQHPRMAAIHRIPALIVMAHLRVRRGDPGAMELLEEARTLAAPTQELQRIGPLSVARAEAAWLAGNREETIREAVVGYELALERGERWYLGELALLLSYAGALQEPPSQVAKPYALQMRGDWRGAAQAWEEIGCPYERARALASSGVERHQREALLVYDAIGAAPAAQRLRAEMRASGASNTPRRTRSSTRTKK
jgi:hypothetical protein